MTNKIRDGTFVNVGRDVILVLLDDKNELVNALDDRFEFMRSKCDLVLVLVVLKLGKQNLDLVINLFYNPLR